MYFLLMLIMIGAAIVCRNDTMISCTCMLVAGMFALADSIMSIGDKLKDIKESLINELNQKYTPNELRKMVGLEPIDDTKSKS